MGRRTAAALASRMMERGIAPDTPALVVSNVSRTDERRLATTLGGLAAGAAAETESGPALILIGAAMRIDGELPHLAARDCGRPTLAQPTA
jgi:siroheme synthase